MHYSGIASEVGRAKGKDALHQTADLVYQLGDHVQLLVAEELLLGQGGIVGSVRDDVAPWWDLHLEGLCKGLQGFASLGDSRCRCRAYPFRGQVQNDFAQVILRVSQLRFHSSGVHLGFQANPIQTACLFHPRQTGRDQWSDFQRVHTVFGHLGYHHGRRIPEQLLRDEGGHREHARDMGEHRQDGKQNAAWQFGFLQGDLRFDRRAPPRVAKILQWAKQGCSWNLDVELSRSLTTSLAQIHLLPRCLATRDHVTV